MNRYSLTEIWRNGLQNWGRLSAYNFKLGAAVLKAQSNFLIPPAKSIWDASAAHMDAQADIIKQTFEKRSGAPPFAVPNATEQQITDKSFYSLKSFKRGNSEKPKMLIVAPMSGHYASILRDTIDGMLDNHDVTIVDWKNPRDIPKSAGVFSFETYLESLVDIMQVMGPDTHAMGISQSTVPLLAITAWLSKHDPKLAPGTLTLIGGPIDTRASKSKIHDFARRAPLDKLKRDVVDAVPGSYKGAGRAVYPGYTQLMALMAQGFDKHRDRLGQLYAAQISNDEITKNELKSFYNDYYAVMDLDAAFFLDTLKHVYQDHSLANGTMTFRGEKIDLSAIKKTALLTIEGAKDSVSPPGETHTAQGLCSNVKRRQKYTHPEFGHYGIAMGEKFKNEISPVVVKFLKTPRKNRPQFRKI